MINGYTDQSFLHICAKTQPTAIYTSQVIAKYVLETNMNTKLSICHMCQIIKGLIWKMYTHTSATYEANVLSHATKSI